MKADNLIDSVFLPDAPLAGRDDDLLGRWPFAERIARGIAAGKHSESIAVGILGGWGSGKTTILNFVETCLSSYPHIQTMRFNPWNFDSDSQLVQNYFRELASLFNRHLTTPVQRVSKVLESYGDMLLDVSAADPTGFSRVLATLMRFFGKRRSNVTLSEQKAMVQRILEDSGKRLVVLVDDIDRLEKERILDVFRLVKLTGDFENMSFVLAFDPVVVGNALDEQYAAGAGSLGNNYLEKVIQVPIQVPCPSNSTLRDLVFREVDRVLRQTQLEINENQVQAFVRAFDDSIARKLDTPRSCKRYANALAFSIPLLRGEVNPVDFLLLEALRVFYPDVYLFARKNRQLFVGTSDWPALPRNAKEMFQASLSDALGEVKEEERARVTRLVMVLFPKTRSFLENYSYGSGWLARWEKERRVSAPDYFERYFIYAIPDYEIADSWMDTFMTRLESEPSGALLSSIDDLLTQKNSRSFIAKSRRRLDKLSPLSAKKLALLLCGRGERFPRSSSSIEWDSAFTGAAILISELVKRVPESDHRMQIAGDIVSLARPLAFSAECFRWLRTSPDEEDRLLSSDQEDQLGSQLAARIEKENEGNPIYLQHGDGTPSLVYVWNKWGNSRKLTKHLCDSFEEDSINVLSFLQVYEGKSTELTSGITHRGPLRQHQYGEIADIVDPDIVMHYLRDLFGTRIDRNLDPGDYADISESERVAYQFSAIYHGRSPGD